MEVVINNTIAEIVDARLGDIALAKKCITTARSEIERQHQFQCAILTIYASLEGGVKEIIGTLLNTINTSGYKVSDLSPCYATLALSKICKFDQQISDLSKQRKVTTAIIDAVLNKAKLPNYVDTESNLTPTILTKISSSLALPPIIDNPTDENDLNILLRFRNNIAHGDRKMPINFGRIDQLSSISIKILCAVGASISEAHIQKVWLIQS